MSHFLFVAGALRERTSEESAELQLGHGLWGLSTELIRTNLHTYLDAESRGLVYVLKVGLCAEFQIVSPMLDFSALDAFKDGRLFILPVRGDQNGDRFPKYLFGRVSEKALRTLVPASDDAVKVFAEDCVVRPLNDGRKVVRNHVWLPA